MSKITKLAILLLIFLITSSALSAKGDSGSSGRYVIGVPTHSFADKWMTYLYDAIRAYDEEHDDVVFKLTDANQDPKRQLNDVDNFIVDGVSALLLIPTDPDIVLPVGQKAKKAGIPLVLVNRLGTEEGMKLVNTYIGSREEDAGIIQAEQVAKLLDGKPGNIGILLGQIGHAAQIGRTKGVEDTIGAKYPNIKVIAKQTGNWDRAKGLAVTQDWFQAYPDINIILGNNDEMAIGAVLAAQKAGKSDADLIIGGVDATPDALEYLGKGLDFSVFQSAVGQGRGAAEAAHKWAKGEAAEKEVWIPFELVTMENASQYKN
ncbi:MAG: sugar ABC transporter substrate-binding protein [Spirochaetota bacterium]